MEKNSEIPKEDVHQAKVLVRGTFKPEDVDTHLSEGVFAVPGALMDKVEAEWKPKAENGWFAGPLLRLDSYELKDGRLTLSFQRTDFKDYVGTRDFETLRKYGVSEIANPLSASSVIFTSDGKMLIGLKEMGDTKGAIDAIGGYADPEKDTDPSTGKPDIFQTAKREIAEEVGIQENELESGTLVGLSYEYAGLCHPVASFSFKTPLTSLEVLSRAHEEMHILVVEPNRLPETEDHEYVMDILKSHYPNIEPDGRVTIALARKLMEGVNYKKEVLRTADLI